jgi:hypothetical protein
VLVNAAKQEGQLQAMSHAGGVECAGRLRLRVY